MCGRFTLRAAPSVIAEQFALFDCPPFSPRFNIAPTQAVPVVRLKPGGDGQAPQREIAWLRWGLIPSWADDPAIGHRMINARAETVADKPAYRAAFRRRRCLVVADGFYEWQRRGKQKQPYFLHIDDERPFGFAGLWESWEGADHSHVESCTILTTEPNAVMEPIHNRMPVILAPDDYDTWLQPEEADRRQLLGLLGPYEGNSLRATPISTWVNNPKHDDPRCVEPVDA